MSKYVFFVVLVFAQILSLCFCSNCKGCTSLDSLTFNKMIRHFRVSLVKIDVPYPYGDKHDEFSKIALDGTEVQDLLVAEVGVKDHGDYGNSDISQRFGLTREMYPVMILMIHNKESNTTEEFKYPQDMEFKANNIRIWIRKLSGIHLPLPGCLEEFDDLADKFMESGSPEARNEILTEAENQLSELGRDEKERIRKAETYIRIMKKVTTDGDTFVAHEIGRVQKVLSGKLAKAKKREMEERLNVLKSFDGKVKVENVKSEL